MTPYSSAPHRGTSSAICYIILPLELVGLGAQEKKTVLARWPHMIKGIKRKLTSNLLCMLSRTIVNSRWSLGLQDNKDNITYKYLKYYTIIKSKLPTNKELSNSLK